MPETTPRLARRTFPLLATAALAAAVLTAPPAVQADPADLTPQESRALDAAKAYLGLSPALRDGGSGEFAALSATVQGDDTTVRLQQRLNGVPVFGAHTLVHLTGGEAAADEDPVTGRAYAVSVSTTPKVTAERAAELALRDLADPRTRASAHVNGHELTILPLGAGVLVWRVSLAGLDQEKQAPMMRDVFVDAATGGVRMAYDTLELDAPVHGDGVNASGATVPVEAYQRGDGRFELRDRTRPMWNGTTGEILTYDSQGGNYWEYLGVLPPDTPLTDSPSATFTDRATESGAVDAHWGAGQVFEYYKDNFGRNGIDGNGGSMVSVVGTTYYGRPFINAFWDGTKMVYGWSNGDIKPLSADLDVVGHEMTHGVISNSANLAYIGQSGAMNEGLADYFGNAIDVNVNGTDMHDPNAGLLGEDLCRTGTPQDCALRDLNDGHTTLKDFYGVTVRSDQGGVHSNSTIFSGALWDVRERLDPALVDKIVYRAVTEYMTPTDTFTDGREAVERAAKKSGLSKKDRKVIADAFEAHGIHPGWERELGVDSRTLFTGVTDNAVSMDASGGAYVVTSSDEQGNAYPTVWAGGTNGGRAKAVSEANGLFYSAASTDGRTAVWSAEGYTDDGRPYAAVLARSLRGGPVRTVVEATDGRSFSIPTVDGDTYAWTSMGAPDFESNVWLKAGDAEPVNVTPAGGVSGSWLDLRGGRLGYIEISSAGGFTYRPTVYDIATGAKTYFENRPTFVYNKDVVLGVDGLSWVQDVNVDGRAAIMHADYDGTNVRAIVAEDAANAPFQPAMEGNALFLTYSTRDSKATGNAALPKLMQVSVYGGGSPWRVSCNRGDQGLFAVDGFMRVVWVDGTTGITNVVTRSAPAVRC